MILIIISKFTDPKLYFECRISLRGKQTAYTKALSIHCKLATPNDESSDLMVAITNTSQQTDLKIGHIYFSTGSFVNYWKNDILPFVLPRDNIICIEVPESFIHQIELNNMIIIYQSDGLEFVEIHSFKVLTDKPTICRIYEHNEPMFIPKEPKVPDGTLKMFLYPIQNYFVPKNIKELVKKRFKCTVEMSEDEQILYQQLRELKHIEDALRLNPANYAEVLSLLIYIEDFTAQKEMYKYDLFVKNIYEAIHAVGGNIFKYKVYNLAKKLPFLMENDRIWISPCKFKSKTERVYGNVIAVHSDAFYFRLERSDYFFKFGHSKLTFRLHFLANRLTYQMEQHAVERVKVNNLSDFMFPSSPELLQLGSRNSLVYFNNDIRSNVEQMQAVENITHGTAYPAPYLIFGPPGTGKTKTIVEAILQIWKTQPNSRILVCASSNSACDEIAQRLLKFIPSQDRDVDTFNLFRLYATSLNKDSPDQSILDTSNFFDKFYPPLPTLYQYRIVVGTLGVAGRLTQARISTNHFTHLFIDECGSATETASLIPIAGICSSMGQLNAHIIMSGDPMQLGPVLSSKTAETLGLGRSMIERLMDMDIYKRDPVTNRYNPKVLTKLIQNYRSHPAIVQLFNQMFYDNELIPCAKREITDVCLNWKLLPANNFPMIFEVAAGEAEQETNCTSWFNKVEQSRVMFYLDELLNNGVNGLKFSQADIGVISPYKKQCTQIEDACRRKGWRDIMISSVEQYQGKEKKIIIVSTVRSQSDNIGFLNNFRRLNVLMSRAQALLIIIGDAKTLRTDANWSKVIDVFEQNNAIISCNGKSSQQRTDYIYHQRNMQ
ncbi:hypothetical protein HA402_010592 [Bradysia odoriphaga]|nr:hypothetical protein HA402_010592 [Bradysia odoriphaga]